MSIYGVEPLIIDAFAENNDERDYRMGFLVYCMQVAMGFKEVYNLALGKQRPQGLNRRNLSTLSRYAMDTITYQMAQEYTLRHTVHSDVQQVLDQINVWKRRGDAKAAQLIVERDHWKKLYDDQAKVIDNAFSKGTSVMNDEIEKATKQIQSERDTFERQLATAKVDLALAKQDLQRLKAQQQLGTKVDAIQTSLSATLAKLSQSELETLKAIQSGSISNPDVQAAVRRVLERTSTWTEENQRADHKQLTDQKNEIDRLQAEVARLNESVQNLNKNGSAAQTTEIQRLTTELSKVTKERDRLSTENQKLNEGGGASRVHVDKLNGYLTNLQEKIQSISSLNTITTALNGSIRASAKVDSLTGILTPDACDAMLMLANDVIDVHFVVAYRESLKDLLETSSVEDITPGPDISSLIKNEDIREINKEAIMALLGFPTVNDMKTTMESVLNISNFEHDTYLVLEEHEVTGINGAYFGFNLIAKPNRSRMPVVIVLLRYFMTQYQLMCCHVKTFQSAFATLDQPNAQMIINYYLMISSLVVPMPPEHDFMTRSDQIGKLLNKLPLTVVDDLYPMLLLTQGYPVGTSEAIPIMLHPWYENPASGAVQPINSQGTKKIINSLIEQYLIHGHDPGKSGKPLMEQFVAAFKTDHRTSGGAATTPSGGGAVAPGPTGGGGAVTRSAGGGDGGAGSSSEDDASDNDAGSPGPATTGPARPVVPAAAAGGRGGGRGGGGGGGKGRGRGGGAKKKK